MVLPGEAEEAYVEEADEENVDDGGLSDAVPDAADGVNVPEMIPAAAADGLPMELPEAVVEEEHVPPAPGRRKRRSIANDNPRALEEAAKDPIVHEIIDLFDGEVVDIHK